MAVSLSDWHADPLEWGRGPKTFEVFLEPTCPYSAKAFGKLDELLARAGEEHLTLKIRLQSQPWHLFSGIVTRAILAASTTPDGKRAAKKVMAEVFTHRDEFEFTDHCTGPNMSSTPDDVIARIERLSGVALATAFRIVKLDRELKWQAKYARQNGIHVSPTFMIDGLVQADMGSGDTLDQWLGKLGLA